MANDPRNGEEDFTSRVIPLVVLTPSPLNSITALCLSVIQPVERPPIGQYKDVVSYMCVGWGYSRLGVPLDLDATHNLSVFDFKTRLPLSSSFYCLNILIIHAVSTFFLHANTSSDIYLMNQGWTACMREVLAHYFSKWVIL